MILAKPVLQTFLILLVVVTCTPWIRTTAQEPGGEQAAAENQAPATKAADENAPADAVRERISAGELNEAVEVLEQALAEQPEAEDLQRMRRMIALRYAGQRKYGEATAEMQKLFDFQLPRTETVVGALELAGQAQQLSLFASRSGAADQALVAIDQALQRCRELSSEDSELLLEPIARLISIKAVTMASAGNAAEARELVVREAKRIEEQVASAEPSESVTSAYISLLTLLGTRNALGSGEEADAQRLNAALQEAIEAFPESRTLRMQYANSAGMRIASIYRENPEAAREQLQNVLEKLSKYADEDENLEGMLSRIKSYESRIDAAIKQKEMIGKPAPELQIDAWVNAEEGAEDSLKGKVVLYDFWAIWCGPCIATFPHLRQWRSEFGEQGFEIVGITRYYGYEWDEQAERATRGQDVSPETEQEAIAKFLQSKDMQHPTIVTPSDSTLQTEYGVTGIPHAVLVDRQGNVQMIKVGSGAANATALEEKIQELLAQ